MSDSEKPAEKPKKKKKTLLFVLLALLVFGGGGGAGIYAAGMIGGGGHASAAQEDPNKPKLKIREGVDEDLAHAAEARLGKRRPDPALFQASYYQLKDNFTANLADSDSFVQVGVGVSTYYDEKVLKAVETHEMAVRSAVLETLGNQDTETVSTPEGKVKLKQVLRAAVNGVLEQKEGFGGIDDVYFTSFVVQ